MAFIGRGLKEWLATLKKDGLIPADTRRILIDIPIDGAVRVVYECYGDRQMFTADLGRMLSDVRSLSVAEVAKENR